MNIEEYNIIQIKENNNQIAIDFDGVIHKNSKGFYDGTVYDPPIEGAIETIKKLSEKYTIVIFTAKVKPDRPLVNGKTGEELIWEWLDKYKISSYIKEITCEKPRAVVYIDDRAIGFKDWNSCLIELKTIEEERKRLIQQSKTLFQKMEEFFIKTLSDLNIFKEK